MQPGYQGRAGVVVGCSFGVREFAKSFCSNEEILFALLRVCHSLFSQVSKSAKILLQISVVREYLTEQHGAGLPHL